MFMGPWRSWNLPAGQFIRDKGMISVISILSLKSTPDYDDITI